MDQETYQNLHSALTKLANNNATEYHTKGTLREYVGNGCYSSDREHGLALIAQALINLECHKKDGGVTKSDAPKPSSP